MLRAFARHRVLRIVAFVAMAIAPPAAQAAAAVSEPCKLEATGIDSAAKDGVRILLGPAHPAGLAGWDVHRWQRHRLWITLTAANTGDVPATVVPQLLVDGLPDGAEGPRLTGRPVTVAPHATAGDRLSIWLPDEAKTLAVRLGEGGGASVSVTFVHECSQARFETGNLAAPAAALLQEAVGLYLGATADQVPNPRLAADTALHLATGAQDGADVAWALRGMMQSLRDDRGFVAGPGEPVPAPPQPRPARQPSFDWLEEGVAVVRLGGGDAGAGLPAQAWAAALHDGVADLAARRPRSWIVDLRGASGDEPWPALAGLSRLLAGPVVGATVRHAARDEWIADRGAARIAGGEVLVDLQSPPEPPFEGPVAVLVDRNTSNGGELVAVAFQGRPHTRFFGAPTAGCPSWCMRTHVLHDGATLGLVEARPADRSGHVQREPVTPDEPLDAAASLDEAPRKAVEWLQDEGRSAVGGR